MRKIRRLALVVVVWATSASMLLGSTPHFVCRCPDGSVKEICFGPVADESSCCCNGSCCSPQEDGQDSCSIKPSASDLEEKPPCCRQPEETEPGPSSSTDYQNRFPGMEGTCCQKTLAQPEAQFLDRPQTKGDESNSTWTDHFLAAPIMNVGNSPGFQPDWKVYGLPPPTDLVTMLQRLTI